MSPGDLPHEAHLAALAALEDVGPARLRWLLSHGAPATVWASLREGRLRAAAATGPVPGSSSAAGSVLPHPDELLRSWRAHAERIDPAALWRSCQRLGVGVVSLGSPAYPDELAADPDPPTVLFHLGDPDRVAPLRVAVIGTRRATGYGLRTARELCRQLAEAGVSVVSGLALGIDAAAHHGALSATSAGRPAMSVGAPVGVVAAGLDAPCPVRNRRLAADVASSGVLWSEVPPGTTASPWRFPVRNRIIAAMAQVVVVVESAGAGGSMHTVREALERDRTVLAVPGPIDSRVSEGTNELIADGATPYRDVDDVLDALGADVSGATRRAVERVDPRVPPQGAAATVLDGLGWRPATVEQLAASSRLDFVQVVGALGELERAGWVRQHGGWVERVARVPVPPDAAS